MPDYPDNPFMPIPPKNILTFMLISLKPEYFPGNIHEYMLNSEIVLITIVDPDNISKDL